MKRHDNHGSAQDEAAEWFVKMRAPVSHAERMAFEKWLSADANARAYANVEQTWDQAMFLANTPTGRGRDLSRAQSIPKRSWAIAAGFAAIFLGVGYWALFENGGRAPDAPHVAQIAEYRGDPESVRVVVLPDGSRVTLDRGALVRDLSSAHERRVLLVGGRARFEITKDTARQFVVDAGAGRVIAHGTVFDVALEGESVRVLLLQGAVEVRGSGSARGAEPVMMAPGDQVRLRDGVIHRLRKESGADAAWPGAMISFDAVPLTEAVAAFNRETGQKIRLEFVGNNAPLLSGTFRRDDARGFAQAIAVSFAMEAGEDASGSIILRKPPTGRKIITG